jgi:hypothetical protein
MSLAFIKFREYCISWKILALGGRGTLFMAEKDCFGILDRVFPTGERGLREVVPECFQCDERVPCLRAALGTRDGLEMRSGVLDRAGATGVMGRLKRWSRKKELSRLIRQEEKRGK